MSKKIKGIVRENDMVHMRLQDGQTECVIPVFDCDEEFVELADKVQQLLEDEDLRCEQDQLMTIKFKPYALLDYYIDGFGFHGSRKIIDSEARPKIEQLRKELQAMINEIDALEYK